MTIQQLPNDLKTGSNCEVQIFDYCISKACIKNKITLNKNVFSFLIDGTKELITKEKSTLIDQNKFLLIKSGNSLMSENLSPSNQYRSMLFFFSDDLFFDFLHKNNITTKNSIPSQPYYVCQYDAYIKHFVSSLMHLKNQPQALQNKLLLTKFEEILTYLLHQKGVDFLQNFFGSQDI